MRPEILVATVVSSPSMRPLSLIRLRGPAGVRIRKYQMAPPASERTISAITILIGLLFFTFGSDILISLSCYLDALLLTCLHPAARRLFGLLQSQPVGNHGHVAIPERDANR